MLKLAQYLKPFWLGLMLIVLLLLGQALAELYLPTLMSDIVEDGIIYAYVTETPRTEFILQTGGLMLFIAFLAGSASLTAAYISPRIAAGMARNLRRDLFTKVESFSQAEFDKFSSASLITRCTNDVAQVQGLANIFARTLLYAPIMAIGGITMALTRSVSMAWIIVLAVIILLGLVLIIVNIVMPKFKIVQTMVDALNKVSREILHGLMVIRAFGTQSHEKIRFEKSNADLRDLGLFIARVMSVVGPAITFIMGGTQILVIWVGAHQVANGNLPIGDMMAFMQYAMQVIIAFMMISMVLVMVPRAQVSAARISEVLHTELTIKDPPNPEYFTETSVNKGQVVFNDVSFNYPGAEASVIENISFTAQSGQTTAIIGATGSGKSTLALLLQRFYDVSQGKITIDGLDIRNVRQADLRKKIGFVPQKGQLISGTIASNIRYGRPNTTDEEMKAIATIAQAIDFIHDKEDQFESEIAQGGTNVSGGQRQRLSIARALAKKPEIIVFDDSFSALDFQTDAKLRKALKEHIGNATVIVIAQRVGTIINAEQILVIDEGKIVGRGTHETLLKSCPAYHEIASSQGVV
ncbi:MAG: ABC transporter ATP-binding protein/permease [Defluviitaleaceae bacterium]|nr:ABC transporter ATP-binding protein/permease [Defluviitaleaceae bacterium]